MAIGGISNSMNAYSNISSSQNATQGVPKRYGSGGGKGIQKRDGSGGGQRIQKKDGTGKGSQVNKMQSITDSTNVTTYNSNSVQSATGIEGSIFDIKL